jgi:hypothetical protein
MGRMEASWHHRFVALKYGKLFILPHQGADACDHTFRIGRNYQV